MTVTIHIPSRIIVDPESLLQRPRWIEDAYCSATGRAIAKSRHEVLEPRGGYLGIRLNAPQFRWTGPAVDEVPFDQRASFEEQIRRLILEQVQSRLHGGHSGRTNAASNPAAPLSGQVFEAFDQNRYHGATGLYEIPSYEDRGKKIPVKIAFRGAPKPAVEYVERVFWHIAPKGLLDNTSLYNKLLLEMLETWGIPKQGPRGMFWREPDRWHLSVHDDDKWYGWVSWDHFKSRRVVDLRGSNPFKSIFVVPDVGVATAKLIPASVARERMKSELRSDIIKHQQQHGPIGSEFAQQLEDKVEEAIKIVFRGCDLSAMVIEINANGADQYLYSPELPKWDGIAQLAPLTSLQRFRKEVPNEQQNEGADVGFGAESGSKAGSGKGHDGAKSTTRKAQGKPGANGRDGQKTSGKEGKSPGALGGYGAPGGVPDENELAKAFGFVYTGEEDTKDAGSAFPQAGSGTKAKTCDSPFNGEPSLKDLGEDGDLLRALIQEIAFKLQIKPCEYAARFAMIACDSQSARAFSVSEYAMGETQTGFLQPVQPKPGSLGLFEFIPAVSPAVQFMRHLAGVTPRISDLVRLIHVIYSKPEHSQKVLADRYASYSGWFIDFGSTINGMQKRAVGYIFAMTCRVLLMQLLRSSRKGIDDRLKNIEAYSTIFEELIRLQLSDLSELSRLRDELRREVSDKDKLKEVGEELMMTWQDARKAIVATFDFRSPFAGIPIGTSQSIIVAPDGTKGIRDSKGNVWTIEQLDRAIALQRDTINQIDPLIPQITMDSEVLGRFVRNPQGTREELEKLLTEMRTNNIAIVAQNRSDPTYGFRAGSINRNIGDATIPGTYYQLNGVHAITHELIAEFFQGSVFYALGVNSLLMTQEGWEDFKMITEFAGVMLLAVLAPAEFVVGGALSIYHYEEAQEKKKLFQSQLDPELVITRAEIEAELFAAELGALLFFIPESQRILKTGIRVAKGAIRGELRAAARVVGRRLGKRITIDMIKALKGNLAESFAKAMLTAEVMNMFLGKLLIEPTVAQMQRDLASYEQIVAMANQK